MTARSRWKKWRLHAGSFVMDKSIISETHNTKPQPEGGDPDSDDRPRKPVFVAGTLMQPGFNINFDEVAEPLNWWDRVVLLGGGCAFGFSLGVSVLLFATFENATTLLCLLVVLLNIGFSAAMYLKTQKLVRDFLRKLRNE